MDVSGNRRGVVKHTRELVRSDALALRAVVGDSMRCETGSDECERGTCRAETKSRTLSDEWLVASLAGNSGCLSKAMDVMRQDRGKEERKVRRGCVVTMIMLRCVEDCGLELDFEYSGGGDAMHSTYEEWRGEGQGGKGRERGADPGGKGPRGVYAGVDVTPWTPPRGSSPGSLWQQQPEVPSGTPEPSHHRVCPRRVHLCEPADAGSSKRSR